MAHTQSVGTRTVQRTQASRYSFYTLSVSDAALATIANVLLTDNDCAACASGTCDLLHTYIPHIKNIYGIDAV